MGTLERALDLLDELVAFPTVSLQSNLDLIESVTGRLEACGARTVITRDPTGARANVFATLGPEGDGGVVLSGHTDVVPVEGQAWATEPYAATRRGDRVYGRGTCDMKGFIACALAMAPRYAALDLARPVHFAFTYDEETGCLGAPVLLEELSRSGVKPSVAIIGEPTRMQVVEGHKGCYEYTTEITGLEGHGSMPHRTVNAVEYAVRYVTRLMAIGADLGAHPPPGSPFDPPGTTVSVGAIQGGIARNIAAGHCRFEWEMRPVTRADADRARAEIRDYAENVLLPEMRARHPEADIVTQVIGEVAGLEPLPDSEAVALAQALTGGNTREVVSYGTEAGLFQAAGIQAVLCGPGSIDQAHKPDEYVEIEQLAGCLGMLERLGERLSAGA